MSDDKNTVDYLKDLEQENDALQAKVRELKGQVADYAEQLETRDAYGQMQAKISDLEAKLRQVEGECAEISAEFGLPPKIRPATGEIRRMLGQLEAERDQAREALRGMEAERNRLNEILKTYVLAMDKLYNHNEAVREAVVMYFGVIHPSETLGEEPICHECGWEIDPEMCWCGDSVTHNSYNAGHTPVPHGCTCGYVDAERRRKPGWTPIRLRS